MLYEVITPPGAEALAPLLQPGLESVLDFLPDDTLVVVDDPQAGHARLMDYAVEVLGNFDVEKLGYRPYYPEEDAKRAQMRREAFDLVTVITSYSIHYTKLYDASSARSSLGSSIPTSRGSSTAASPTRASRTS